LERGVAVRQGRHFLRTQLPGILATGCEVLSARMVHLIEDLAGDWRRLDERIQGLSGEIDALARLREEARKEAWRGIDRAFDRASTSGVYCLAAQSADTSRLRGEHRILISD